MKKYIKTLVILLVALALLGTIKINSEPKFRITGYTKYTIQEGDCMWTIADKYKPEGKTTKNFLAQIQFLNNVNETIYPGQELSIPKEELE